ncbi:MAG: hypothetical protein ABL958_09220 [Bdellovibrionia bacterium]
MRALVAVLVLLVAGWSQGAFAAIAVDDSTVARVTVAADNATDYFTANFTPPSGSLLLVLINVKANSCDNTISTSISSSNGLSFFGIDEQESGTVCGYAGAYYAKVVSGVSMNIAVSKSADLGATDTLSFKVYIVTGHDSTTPIGAKTRGTSTTNNYTSTTYTSTVSNSRGFGVATDGNVLGTPASTDTEDAGTSAGQISFLSAYKASDTGSSGSSVSLNFDAAGASAAAWNWITFEVKPAAGGGGGANPATINNGFVF